MTGEWFDAVVVAAVQARTRRTVLAALASAIAAGTTANEGKLASAGQIRATSQCREKRSKCRRNGQCCSGRCRKRKGKKKGKCRCSRYLEPCRKSSDCCPSAAPTPLVCASGTCQT